MIVPDKKTEAYLNRPVQAKDIVRLCRAGILLPTDFLKAVVLCRSDKKWLDAGRNILSLLAYVSFAAAAFFLVLSRWHFFYTVQGAVCLGILFVLCSCMRRFAMADYAGGLLIGAMVFLPDLIFGMNVFLYETFFLWFLLSLPWALLSDRAGVRLSPLILLNGSLALYGIQFVLPFSLMDVDTFCALVVLLNVVLLGVREGTLTKTKLFESSVFRMAPVFFSCFFLLTGVAGQLFFKTGSVSFVYCLIFTVGAGGFYSFGRFDRRVCRSLLAFCALWISLLLYREGAKDMPLFFTLESLLVIATVVLDRQFDLFLKDENNDD